MITSIRILLVGDDADVVQGTRRVLEQAGCVVELAASAKAARETLRAHKPDLLLLERSLPDQDGLELCLELKRDPALAEVFVVLICGMKTQTEEQIAGLEAGADAYILRPIGDRELTARLEAFVRLQQLTRSLREHARALEDRNRALTQSRIAALNLLQDAIDARRRAEQANLELQQQIAQREQIEIERQKFFLLAESSSEFIGMCDLDMNLLYVNPAGRRMVGLPDMAAACRVTVQDYFFPEDQRFIAEEFFPRVLREDHGEVEIRLRHFQTGEPIWMFYNLFTVRDPSGKAIGWATVSRDITERKRAEAALRSSEERFSTIFRTSPVAIALTRMRDNILVDFNRAWEEITGYPRAEALGHSAKEINLWVEPALRQKMVESLQEQGVIEGEAKLRRKTGAISDTSMLASIVNLAGEDHLLSMAQDITRRKRAEEALAIQVRVASIFLTIPDDEMFNELLKVILDITHSPFGFFGYLGEAGELIVPTMTREIWDRCQIPDKTHIFPPATWRASSWVRAIREQKANYSNEVSTKTPAGHVLLTRHINMPILFRDKVIGIFEVANKETDYTEEDVRKLEAIAAQVASLLNARLQRERVEGALRRRNDELTRFNHAATGRELRMIELKRRINELSRRLGEPPPYSLAFLPNGETENPPAADGQSPASKAKENMT